MPERMNRRLNAAPIAATIILIAPVMIYYATFILYPIGATIVNSFYRMTPRAGQIIREFVGFQNFRALFSDRIFGIAVRNTLIWAVVGTSVEMVTALALAFIVFFKVPFHRFYRIAWFTPILITGVIVGVVFRWIFNYDWGLVNAFLRLIGLERLAVNWLGRPDLALGVVIFVHFWNTFGYSFILLLAGLSSVGQELIESAEIDGANRLQISRAILAPMLLPVTVTTMILAFMGKMRAFHVVWVLTNGGPMNQTETVATYVQKRAFNWSSLDLGYPSAIAVFWFVLVILGVTAINRWLQSRTENL